MAEVLTGHHRCCCFLYMIRLACCRSTTPFSEQAGCRGALHLWACPGKQTLGILLGRAWRAAC